MAVINEVTVTIGNVCIRHTAGMFGIDILNVFGDIEDHLDAEETDDLLCDLELFIKSYRSNIPF